MKRPRPATAIRPWKRWDAGRSTRPCLDLRLAEEQGLDLLPRLLGLAPGLHVVVVTAYATIETAVEAMRRGAFDYLPKPFTPGPASRACWTGSRGCGGCSPRWTSWKSGSARWCRRSTCKPASRACGRPWRWPSRRPPARRPSCCAAKAAPARACWPRPFMPAARGAAGPFVTVHCPSLSAELLESELFGHVQGAFTGAMRDTVGKVSMAEGGTLFLDEIGDLPLALQPKLLRLLQERCYERVGEARTRASNIRILAATNRDLEAEIAAGRFREDLFYRLNVIEVTLPPLRAAGRRHPALGRAPVALLRPAERQGHFGVRRPGAARPAALSLAGQHPRAAQRRRAGRDPGLRPSGRAATTCRRRSAAGRAARPTAARARDARPDRGRAHPPRPGGRRPRSRKPPPSWASTRARCTENGRTIRNTDHDLSPPNHAGHASAVRPAGGAGRARASRLIYHLGSRIEKILRENYDSVIYMRDLNEALERIDSSFQFALAGREKQSYQQYRTKWKLYDASLAKEQHNITLPGEAELVDALTKLTRPLSPAGRRLLASGPRPARQALLRPARSAGPLRHVPARSRPFPARSCGSTRRTWNTPTRTPGRWPAPPLLVRRRPGLRHRLGGAPDRQHDPHDPLPDPRGDGIGHGDRGGQSGPAGAHHLGRRAGATGHGLQRHGPATPRLPPVAPGAIDPRTADQPGHDRFLSRSGAGGRSAAARGVGQSGRPGGCWACCRRRRRRAAARVLGAARRRCGSPGRRCCKTQRAVSARGLRQGHRPADGRGDAFLPAADPAHPRSPTAQRWGPPCCWKTSPASASWTR